jgi:hypothetical protein
MSTATLQTLYRLSTVYYGLSTDSLQSILDSLQTLYSYYGLSTDSLQPPMDWLQLSMAIYATTLQQCCCSIPEFADVDVWTSPNNKAYVAFTVHLEQKGKPLMMLLDIVEVPKSHSGRNLTCAFIMVLEDFGVSKKVSLLNE